MPCSNGCQKYPNMFKPMTIRGKTWKNRVIASPITANRIVDHGYPTPEGIDAYETKSRGGFAQVTVTESFVDHEYAWRHEHGLNVWEDPMTTFHMESIMTLTEAIKAHGAIAMVQLNHVGAMNHPDTIPGHKNPIGPSAFVRDDGVKVEEMTIEQIEYTVNQFAEAAWNCKALGFDGVNLHGGHGWLLNQFLSPRFNHRTDEYGGFLENRYRFAAEIVQAIKKECGKDFPVSLRYSVVSKTKDFRKGALPGEDYIEVGRDMEESIQAVKFLEEAGYDMLNCDNGTYDAWYWAHPPIYMKENCNLDDVVEIRKHCHIPVVCAGRMDPAVAGEAIKDKKIDAAGFARPFLADPAWISKLMQDRLEDIRPCILCHNGCFNMCHYEGVPNDQALSDSLHLARCAVNAETMQKDKHYIRKTKKGKEVIIIGGGIGGMECARVLKLRGHTPVLYEASGQLGGTFIAASAESYKGKLRDLLNWYRKTMKDMEIEVHLNEKIDDLSRFKGKDIIIATGAKARKLNIPGFERTIEACEYLLSHPVSDDVALIGGGLTGCEIAYELALQGKHVSIIEMKNDLIAQTGVCLANSSYLREWFALHKVPVYLNTIVKQVKEDELLCMQGEEEIHIPCTSVISSVGYLPSPLAEKKGKVHLVGDCKKVANLRTVIWDAYETAMKI